MNRLLSTAAVASGGDCVALKGVMRELRHSHRKEIAALPEIVAREKLADFLSSAKSSATTAKGGILADYEARFGNLDKLLPSAEIIAKREEGYKYTLTPEQVRQSFDAALLTFHLHAESRIAALCGQGFYTIGPCGEEMLSTAAYALQPTDSSALHYRHLSVSILRQLMAGRDVEDIALDRARGHTVSRFDPVTSGVHCAIGAPVDGDEVGLRRGGGDFLVTSTLASQCPPAVGRALGFSFAHRLLPQPTEAGRKAPKQVSFVTLGDGSVNNAHFLSSVNLARYARFRRIKCPVVFGISDNGLSISFANRGYLDAFVKSLSGAAAGDSSGRGTDIPVFRANGNDPWDVHDATQRAASYSRKYSAPSVVVYSGITRRFGHAATDRQHAYLDDDDVQSMMDTCVLSATIAQAVERGDVTAEEMERRSLEIQSIVEDAFDVAVEEPKVDERGDMEGRVSAELVAVPSLPSDMTTLAVYGTAADDNGSGSSKKRKKGHDVMRKHMTKVVDETLATNPDVVYVGEDVEHGGYYLVTDGLATKYPGRVCDFPPDETTLIGVGMGYSQCGMTPIVEIPYAKYLDCGADMFYEAALLHWLSDGRQPNGMIIRLQGFDRGTFGGNFHTHNMLHMPPGVDVVCYSNGTDYVRGFRNAVVQARAGRVVMLVDSTNLLNMRHLYETGDRRWERSYPSAEDGAHMMGFHEVVRYGKAGNVAIATYGNGVVTALQARHDFAVQMGKPELESSIDVIDCPLLSEVSDGLRACIRKYDHVVFADVCKEGLNPLSVVSAKLHSEGALNDWRLVCAPRAYNPLGNPNLTFLNREDIVGVLHDFHQEPRQA